MDLPEDRDTSEQIPASQAEWIRQSDHKRVVVDGCLAQVIDGRVVPGGRCTLTFLRFREGWVIYRHGIEEDPVLIAVEDAQKLADGLRGAA